MPLANSCDTVSPVGALGTLERLRRALADDRVHVSTRAQYLRSAPSPQATLDIFRGQWSSSMPPPLDALKAGRFPLYEDERLTWGLQQLGGVQGASVLELGPLEGGHSYLLDRAGAGSVTSIEGNVHAYVRCLVVKELLGMERWNVLCGDLIEFLRATDDHYDVCVAAGVLYHQLNPVELIALTAERADRLYIQTHYFDEAAVSANASVARHFRNPVTRDLRAPATRSTGSFTYLVYPYSYGIATRFTSFCGGPNPTASWMAKDAILEALEHFGWTNVVVGFDERADGNGPWLALTAEKR